MPIVELTAADFAEVVERNDIVLIDFWAQWCGPCRRFAPVFDAAAERNPDVVFAKVDTEAQPELAAAFGVQSIPTLVVFREQVMLYAEPGALPAPVLDELIAKVRQVDMAAVHRDAAERRPAQA